MSYYKFDYLYKYKDHESHTTKPYFVLAYKDIPILSKNRNQDFLDINYISLIPLDEEDILYLLNKYKFMMDGDKFEEFKNLSKEEDYCKEMLDIATDEYNSIIDKKNKILKDE